MTAARGRTRDMVTAALVAALLCVSSYLTIPLQPVPITLQFLLVALAALLLSPMWAAAATATYVVLGAVGLPVFAQGSAGIGVILGPTGGYLIGFVAGAWLGSLVRERVFAARGSSMLADVVGSVTALVLVYGIGAVWLAAVAQMSAGAAFVAGVAPFIAFDAVKGVVAITAAAGIRRATDR